MAGAPKKLPSRGASQSISNVHFQLSGSQKDELDVSLAQHRLGVRDWARAMAEMFLAMPPSVRLVALGYPGTDMTEQLEAATLKWVRDQINSRAQPATPSVPSRSLGAHPEGGLAGSGLPATPSPSSPTHQKGGSRRGG